MSTVQRRAALAGASRQRSPVLAYLGFVPALLLFGVCFAAAISIAVVYSFWQVDQFFNVLPHWTLGNYAYFFRTATYVRTFAKTVLIAAGVTAACIVAAFPYAYYLVRYVHRQWHGLFLAAVVIPFWSSYLLRVYAWMEILGTGGLINRALMDLKIIHAPLPFLLNNTWAVVIVLVYLYFPFAALTLYSSLEKVDWSQVRAALDLGATPTKAFLYVLLPAVYPGVVTGCIFVFIPVLGEYLAPSLVGGTSGVTVGMLVVNLFKGGQIPLGAAISLLIAALISAILLVFRKYLKVEDTYGA